MDEKTIMIGIGSRPEGGPMAAELESAEEADTAAFEAMAPKGNFTQRGLVPLVRATNALLPLFDQTPDYPEVEDTKQLPTDFVRILAMFQSAVEDAIARDVVRDEMRIDLDGVIDDTGLMTLAGKLDMLSKDKDFKRFLSEPAEEEVVEEEVEPEGMSYDDEDELLMSRM